ncbi:class I SAM-dependent methyltransferase [Nocardia transvalensis]|uniref:class I SAM-dependent methyltransferase n=1 Tax=Nocardia transvalensis TaxID=37333 RepID=UPI001894BFCE|nr:class I SAM-dependent methyltransferase [Nocardia transvalensis]MBF6331143.1 class I SAM-dependent methyltransferase [Nocardia transvalensis]
MPDPSHFDNHAEIYDRARPPYPTALWARLTDLGLLRQGTRVIELGAGTGLATGPMLRAGASVTAVEPGAALADRLRRRWPEATVYVDRAESVPLPPAAFDLAVAATAVHWFDLDVVLPRLHRALVPEGHFAVWRNAFGAPAAAVTPFRERVAAITARRGEQHRRRGPGELDTDAWMDRLTSSGHFAAMHVEQFSWTIELRSDQIHDLFTTFSNWNPAEVDEAAQAAHDLGGRVTEQYVTPLIVLKRIARHVIMAG